MITKLQFKYIALGIGFVVTVAYLVAKSFTGLPHAEGTFETFLKIFREPIIVVVLGPLLAFLFYDRWKEMKTDISEIRTNRDKDIQNLREELKELLNSRLDSAVQKARALDR